MGLTWVGDTDGDGLDDILVGAPGCDSSYLVRGRADLADMPLTFADATFQGHAYSDLGFCQAGAGDVDGDGYPDLLLGASGDDTVDSSAGAAYLFMGGPALCSRSVDDADATFLGLHPYDNAGDHVAGVGDLDSDGFAEIAIGALGADGDLHNIGVVHLVWGAPDIAGGSLSGADVILWGEAGDDFAGSGVAGIGDVDGDGTPDIAVGAVGSDAGACDGGAVYLVSAGLLW
jgi:hypothetical protein